MDEFFSFASQELVDETNKNNVVLADSIEFLNSLEAESVQCIITDPPYGIAYHSNYYKDKNPHAPIAHDWNFQIGPYFSAAERVLKVGGSNVYIYPI